MVDEPREEQIDLDEVLFEVSAKEYGVHYQDHLLEQYKLYVQMADKISDRRQSANNFFLTVNTAVLAFLGIVVTPIVGASSPSAIDGRPLPWALVISAAGVILCYFWYRLVRSYTDLNTGKFKVVQALESKLPSSPYDAEWEAVGRSKNPKLYLPFTDIETRIPWVFLALYVAFATWNIIQVVY
jgi:hypothetical protein